MMKVHRLLLSVILFCLTLTCIIVFAIFQLPDNQRAKLCSSAQPLAQIQVKDYDVNGVNFRDGTFIRKISQKNKTELPVIIFPRALSSKIWSKLPQSSIQYLGKGGDNSWRELLRPDYFYLLEVPPQATGLAFGRLCYRNGDVGVHSIDKLKEISPPKVIINDKIYLSHSSPLPTINPSHIYVNTGNNSRDALGTQTEVYFTTHNLSLE